MKYQVLRDQSFAGPKLCFRMTKTRINTLFLHNRRSTMMSQEFAQFPAEWHYRARSWKAHQLFCCSEIRCQVVGHGKLEDGGVHEGQIRTALDRQLKPATRKDTLGTGQRAGLYPEKQAETYVTPAVEPIAKVPPPSQKAMVGAAAITESNGWCRRHHRKQWLVPPPSQKAMVPVSAARA
jgi:hypothetical protein